MALRVTSLQGRLVEEATTPALRINSLQARLVIERVDATLRVTTLQARVVVEDRPLGFIGAMGPDIPAVTS